MVHLNRMRATSEAGEDGKHFYKGSMPQNCCEETNAHKSFHSHLSSSKQASRNESESEDCDGVIRVPSGSGFRMMKPFPWLLHEMLEDIEKKRLSWVVSWSPDGRAFQVHSPERFSDTILPTYFRHKRYKSFQVSLGGSIARCYISSMIRNHLRSRFSATTIPLRIQVSTGRLRRQRYVLSLL